MKPLYTQDEYIISKSEDKLPFKCYHCDNIFYKPKKEITYEIKNKRGAIKYCSIKCFAKHRDLKKTVSCLNCFTIFDKMLSRCIKTKNHFCTKSCASTYNQAHKTRGIRRSKLEKYLEDQLTLIYPTMQIDFNKKDTIKSELDIYIPSLKLAFELNGILHYKPIYGVKQFDKICKNDQYKYQACTERDISLYAIDTTKQKNFTESTSQEFIDIITNTINKFL